MIPFRRAKGLILKITPMNITIEHKIFQYLDMLKNFFIRNNRSKSDRPVFFDIFKIRIFLTP
ncbi:hypothetical protein AAJ76_850001309 [Vairimorpha ceranae]|uniref:Uncharacterized protein n=1 Tax=Vairimorpha ceranae TaxID=40302 RepID=A0A0F9YNP0_9MICR|nr:hypothetical protein AAJ76_850001309 [Vairimorpha ceranae]KKO74302.1 hypothetical protein AAJ76_850001309 [Vairimorpha ceranae]